MIKNLRADGKSHRILRIPKDLVDSNKDKFEEVFQGMDLNNNREIDMEEFTNYIENYQRKTSPTNTAAPTIVISETPQRKTSKGKKKGAMFSTENSNSYSDKQRDYENNIVRQREVQDLN